MPRPDGQRLLFTPARRSYRGVTVDDPAGARACPAARAASLAVPVRIEYALTPLGTSLMSAVNALKTWAEKHIDEIETARAAYDQAAV
jgi:hypothetical protein